MTSEVLRCGHRVAPAESGAGSVRVLLIVAAMALAAASCSAAGPPADTGGHPAAAGAAAVATEGGEPESGQPASGQPASDQPASDQPVADAQRLVATFAGGCFWCVEAAFEKVPGVLEVVSGYTGGSVEDPSYREVSSGRTGHVEAVQVWFDPERVSFEDLLAVYWRNIDPTTKDRQFCDFGSQYRTAVFYHDDGQRRAAERTRDELVAATLDQPIVTEILPFTGFYRAEEYHQDFYKKSPVRYEQYRRACGRDQRLRQLWGGQAPAP